MTFLRKYHKPSLIALAALFLVGSVIGTASFFTDRISERIEFTTASFEKEGYRLSLVSPDGPFSAGEDIEITLTEQNNRSDGQEVTSTVSMLVDWDSLDPSYSLFDDESMSISMDGQKIEYALNADGSLSFDLPSHILTKERSGQERTLAFHLPNTLSSAGTLNFQFDQVEVKQSPNGFSNTYTNADLNKSEQLDFSVKVGKIIGIEVTSPPDKTTYNVGEDFDAAGMVVEKVYETGQKEPVSDYTIIEGEDLPAGKSEVQIRYKENGVTYTTATTIEVIPKEYAIGDLEVGSLIQLKESGSPVNYRIVHQGLPSSMYDASCDGTWVLREEIHSNMVFDSTNNDYKNSDVHSWLNGTFLDTIDSDIQSIIKQIKIPYQNGTGNGGSVASGSNGLSTKAFLLGSYELGWTTSDKSNIPVDGVSLDYFSGLSAYDTKRAAYYNGTVSEWKLRSPYTTHYSSAMAVRTGTSSEVFGELFADDVVDSSGIRPAIVLLSDVKVNSTPNVDGSYSIDFTGNAYQVKYNANGGSGSMDNSDHVFGTAKALTANTFTRDGYTFKGWSSTASGDVVYEDKASVSNLTTNGVYELYAVWEPITYQVRYNANGGSGTMANSDHVYDTASALSDNAFTHDGYIFKGWATSAGGVVSYENGATVKNLVSNGVFDLYAVWEEVLINWAQYSCNSSYTGFVQITDTVGQKFSPNIMPNTVDRYTKITVYTGYSFSEESGYSVTGQTTIKGTTAGGLYRSTTVTGDGYIDTVICSLKVSNGGPYYDGTQHYYTDSIEVARARSTRTAYTKGSATGNIVTTEGGEVPNGGTIVDGSLDGDYVVVLEGSTYYYYEKSNILPMDSPEDYAIKGNSRQTHSITLQFADGEVSSYK